MDLSRLTNYIPQIHPPNFARYRALISNHCAQLYSRLPDIRALAQTYIPIAYNRARPILWEHRHRIIGSMALGALAWRVISYIRSRPQYPIVSLKSSLNVATLSIETLKSEVVPPNVSLTFCVDTSGSMQGERHDAVKAGVNRVLDSALRVVNAIEGAKIEIAIVGFNSEASIISEPTVITAGSSLDEIKGKLEGYRSNGTTKIIAGLDQATTTLEEIARKDCDRVHTLILLSDGGEDLSEEAIQPIHRRLAKVNAQLFAIGIGRGHNQKTLQKIAPEAGRFRGTYIDTTLEDETIEGAITSIYEQAVAIFSELVLSTTHLEEGAWSVDRTHSVDQEGKSVCQLGSFTEERGVVKRIEIHSAGLREKLDLADVVFDLAFKDPRGRAGTMKLHWKPNTVMDPEIIN